MVYWYDFVSSPPGFFGKDIAIDAASSIVSLMISYFSFKYFLLDKKNKKQLLATLGFFLLGISFIAKIMTTLVLNDLFTYPLHFVLFGIDFGLSYHVFSAMGFLTHAFMTLLGFYLLYALTSKEKLSMNYIMIGYLLFISTYFSRFNYAVFYLTALMFVASLSRRYYLSYKENKYRNTMLLSISFGVISLSQILFIFTILKSRELYVAAEILQLVGYLGLLYTFLMVLKNARQTNKA
jgi:hypothetical protein